MSQEKFRNWHLFPHWMKNISCFVSFVEDISSLPITTSLKFFEWFRLPQAAYALYSETYSGKVSLTRFTDHNWIVGTCVSSDFLFFYAMLVIVSI